MAAGSTYTPISTQTLGSAVATVTFSSIPGTYTDLILAVNAKCTNAGGQNSYLTLNGDTGLNYSQTSMYGTNPTPGSNHGSSNGYAGYCIVDTIGEYLEYTLNGYADTNFHKTVLGRGASSLNYIDARVSTWHSNSAITSIAISSSGGNWAVGSVFTLYGITAA